MSNLNPQAAAFAPKESALPLPMAGVPQPSYRGGMNIPPQGMQPTLQRPFIPNPTGPMHQQHHHHHAMPPFTRVGNQQQHYQPMPNYQVPMHHSQHHHNQFGMPQNYPPMPHHQFMPPMPSPMPMPQHLAPAHHLQHHHHPVHVPLPVPDRSVMSQKAAPAPLLPTVIAVFSAGQLEGVKTQLCAYIAEQKKYRLIQLAEKVDENNNVTASRFSSLESMLEGALREAPAIAGFVLEDCACLSKHEIFLVDDTLQRLKLRFEGAVYLSVPLATSLDSIEDRVKHPVGFEICCKYLGERVSVLEPKDDESMASLFSQIEESRFRQLSTLSAPLEFPEEELLCKGCVLERNIRVVCSIQESLAKLLNIELYTPPYVTPARILEYSYFTRRAHQLRSYQATFNVDGERLCIVGTRRHVYLAMGATGMFFRLDDDIVPRCLKHLITEVSDEDRIAFVFSATYTPLDPASSSAFAIFINDVLYVEDGTPRSSLDMYLAERLEYLRTLFADDDNKHPFVIQPYFKVNEIENWIDKSRSFVSNGLVLIHPGFATPGNYDRQNYVWMQPDRKNVEVRLWNGMSKIVNATEYWFFDAFVIESDGSNGKLQYQVVIPDNEVTENCLNDGNVVECSLVVETSAGAPPSKAKKTIAASIPTSRLQFVRRKPFALHPTSRVFADAILKGEPQWQKESLVRATKALPYLELKKPAAHTDAEE